MKRLILTTSFIFIISHTYSQYAGTTYLNKQEPSINLKTDEEILVSISLQKKNQHLTLQEEELLYWMDFARKSPRLFYDSVICSFIKAFPELRTPYRVVNSLKRDLYNSKPLPLLVLNKQLFSLSQEHTEDVRCHNNPGIGHNSSTGKSFQDRVRRLGLNVCAAENISYGSSSVLMQLVLLYLDFGVADVGHRKNLLNPDYVGIGLSVIKLKDGQIFLIQDFCCAVR